MKKNLLKLVTVTCAAVMICATFTACGSKEEAPAVSSDAPTNVSADASANADVTVDTSADASADAEGLITYEIETFDGEVLYIDDTNIISQVDCENVFETDIVPADAEVIAPGRDFVYLEDADYYYVEDAINRLVTVASK